MVIHKATSVLVSDVRAAYPLLDARLPRPNLQSVFGTLEIINEFEGICSQGRTDMLLGVQPHTQRPIQTASKIIPEFLHYFQRRKNVVPTSIFATHKTTA
jgi:hypothetical protein